MPIATAQPADTCAPEELEQAFVEGLRQRFKAEVNRMTEGAMARHLAGHPESDNLSFLLSYLYAFHWLRRHVPERYRNAVLSVFRGPSRAFLMDMLEQAEDAGAFVRAYIGHWCEAPADSPLQRRQLLELLGGRQGDAVRLEQEILRLWETLGLFAVPDAAAYRDLGRQERLRYAEMLGPEDQERFSIVDALPAAGEAAERFPKLGVVPAMGCPQTCRHCMFIWRPPMAHTRDPEPLFQWVNRHTDSVLFTGGDLTRKLDSFFRAIGSMRDIRTFAILLNGDFASDREATESTLRAMAKAIRERPAAWPQAHVLLQISFDEFHQEILLDRNGRLKERISVAKIANIVECAPRHPEIQLCLVHKQNTLNFSMDLFQRGVFGRLVKELGRRRHQVRILAAAPSPRQKRDPLNPLRVGPVLKDASFVLARYPDQPVLLTSSTIDAYGRASLLEEGEAVRERDLVHRLLRDGPQEDERFDTDLMFWFNGWVTLFSAVHISLGDFYRDGPETILQRYAKDPLVAALHRFDRRVITLYAEVRDDLEDHIAQATSPHHLFHRLTEEAAVRLHMTRRLARVSS